MINRRYTAPPPALGASYIQTINIGEPMIASSRPQPLITDMRAFGSLTNSMPISLKLPMTGPTPGADAGPIPGARPGSVAWTTPKFSTVLRGLFTVAAFSKTERSLDRRLLFHDL
jgi:hypothetical protein